MKVIMYLSGISARKPRPQSLIFARLLGLTLVLAGVLSSRLAAADSNLDESIRQVRMGTLVIETQPGAEVVNLSPTGC